jgi:general secretion pathway protein F
VSTFRYTARNSTGGRISGSLEADSEGAVMRFLEEKSLFPVAVSSEGGAAEKTKKGFLKRGVRNRDIGTMYGQLADLIGSGVPLLRALDSLVRSTPNVKLVAILRELRGQVADGKSLTEAVRSFPETFPPLHTAMIQAGERAAFLEDVLRGLAGFVERIDELRSKVMGALIYPALLVTLGVTIMFGALVFFVPKFEPLLANAKKPAPTVLIFAMSTAVRSYWWAIALGLAGGASVLVQSFRGHNSRRTLEKLQMKIPVAGEAMRMLAITRFCRILGTMLANGVPLLQALKISKDATGSTLMADQIGAATESVRDGKSLSTPLSAGGLFPDQVLAMIMVAEESNKLDKVLLQIADTVERRTNRQVDQAVKLIEPAILCLVAACIGFLALGLLLPIFTLASSLGSH